MAQPKVTNFTQWSLRTYYPITNNNKIDHFTKMGISKIEDAIKLNSKISSLQEKSKRQKADLRKGWWLNKESNAARPRVGLRFNIRRGTLFLFFMSNLCNRHIAGSKLKSSTFQSSSMSKKDNGFCPRVLAAWEFEEYGSWRMRERWRGSGCGERGRRERGIYRERRRGHGEIECSSICWRGHLIEILIRFY